MAKLTEVSVLPLDPERFESVVSPDQFAEFIEAIVRALEILDGRIVWNVNSTARGGGVAEMLKSLLAYAQGGGVDARWMVIEGVLDFFKITKRIHNHLHGSPGDGGHLGDEERVVYEQVLQDNAAELTKLISADDVVILHDPQTAGLASAVKDRGAHVIWRCHVGLDKPEKLARNAWAWLTPYVERADAYVFSRKGFVWESLDSAKIALIPPSIDAFSAKNQELEPSVVDAILAASALVNDGAVGRPEYVCHDGTKCTVEARAVVVEEAPLTPEQRFVAQVSRWDRLKDPVGVITGFADHVAPKSNAHLLVAGPAVEAVTDDPEGAEVLDECTQVWKSLPSEVRSKIHLACLPMDDLEENAAIVNALQRKAVVVVQKSLAEGFGLTVAEAMWKARPVVASRIGGIQDQVVDGVTGYLIDPTDLTAYGEAVCRLLDDEQRARQMGMEAQRRVRDEFLGPRHLMQYVDLIDRLLDPERR
ncbi:MAG: glycosyltransferase [Actinomycetota bacterium]